MTKHFAVRAAAVATAGLLAAGCFASVSSQAAPQHAADRPVATSRAVIRPVTSGAVAAPGWRVVNRPGTTFCEGESSAAVDRGIDACFPMVDNEYACWHAARPRYVLCLVDPFRHVLVRRRLAGSFAVAAPDRRQVPIELQLFNGEQFELRIDGTGGLSPRNHPNWTDFYDRFQDGEYSTIEGWVHGSEGIRQARPIWRVREYYDLNGPGVIRRVLTAYDVGTAR